MVRTEEPVAGGGEREVWIDTVGGPCDERDSPHHAVLGVAQGARVTRSGAGASEFRDHRLEAFRFADAWGLFRPDIRRAPGEGPQGFRAGFRLLRREFLVGACGPPAGVRPVLEVDAEGDQDVAGVADAGGERGNRIDDLARHAAVRLRLVDHVQRIAFRELDVQEHQPRVEFAQQVDRVGQAGPRPRPVAEALQGRVVDGDDRHGDHRRFRGFV